MFDSTETGNLQISTTNYEAVYLSDLDPQYLAFNLVFYNTSNLVFSYGLSMPDYDEVSSCVLVLDRNDYEKIDEICIDTFNYNLSITNDNNRMIILGIDQILILNLENLENKFLQTQIQPSILFGYSEYN